MKKTITSALLTLALVGFANAARPIVQNPSVTVGPAKPFVAQDSKVLYANIFKLKTDLANMAQMQKQSEQENGLLTKYLGDARKQVETLKKENNVLKDKIKKATEDIQPTLASPAEVSKKVFPRHQEVTRQKLQEAYVKAFDLNKDGQVSIKETPNRKQRNEFLHNFQNDNYRQDEIPVAQRRNSKPPKTKLKPRTPPKTKLKPRTPNSVEQKPARNILQGTRPEISGIGMPYGQLLCGTGYGRTPVPHITMSEAKAMLSKTRK